MGSYRKPLLFITLFALGFFILSEFLNYSVGLKKAKEEAYENDKVLFETLTQTQAESLKVLASTLSLDSIVIEGYEKDDPQIIIDHILPIWEKVRNEKLVYEIHFFKPPATSFVNFSNFKSLGADVRSVRTDIQWITSSFEPSTHALMCKTFAGFRATYPIIDNKGDMLGGVSLGRKIDWVPSSIKTNTKRDSFLIYNKRAANSLVGKYYDEFISDKIMVGEYLLANQTMPIKPELIPSIDFYKEMQDIVIDNRTYSLNIFPIIDFNKATMGYLCTLNSLDDFHERFFERLVKNFFLILATAIIIFLLTRRETLLLLSKIQEITAISNKIKNRDFETLHDDKEALEEYDQKPIDKLKEDILQMGLELEKKYLFLEYKNKEMSKQLLDQLYIDELTSLGNRNALFDDMSVCKEPYLGLINIKNFRLINDVFGFESGNFVLKELGELILGYTQKQNILLYRIGNDEFALLCDATMSKHEFELFIFELNKKIEQKEFHLYSNEATVMINTYMGISFDSQETLTKADMALTQAKIEHKDYVVFSESQNNKEEQKKNIEIINRVQKALEQDRIIVHYQAIVDRTFQPVKYEALVRMMSEEGKVLTPFHFLEITKKTKYYTQITRRVIIKTFELFESRQESFSINLTAEDMLNHETTAFINHKLSSFSDPQRVLFEIVESEDVYNIKEIRDYLLQLKSIGAQIAIDDFGTGYSNFGYIMQLSPDILKIDGSLIKNIDTDAKSRKIVKTIVLFAHELGIKVVAEFVHSQSVLDICIELGVDEFQGYLFSEPKEHI